MILVTGNLGYIGRIMTRYLGKVGFDVLGVDAGFYKENLFYEDSFPPARQLYKDIRDVEEKDLEGVEAVIHLAALSTDFLGEMNPALTHDINGMATWELARKAKNAGVERFIFSSSCSLYGVSDDSQAIIETGKLNPITAYAKAKARAEDEIAKLADDSFHPVFMRNATVYGLSPALRLDLVLNIMTADALLKKKITVFSDGAHWRPMVHVEDLCRAFTCALQAPAQTIHNQAINVGITEENFQVREIAEKVKESLPYPEIEIVFVPGEGGRTYRVDCSKIQKVLPSFKPQWTLQKGIEELHKAYLEKKLSLEGMASGKYFRIGCIKDLMKRGRLDDDLRWKN